MRIKRWLAALFTCTLLAGCAGKAEEPPTVPETPAPPQSQAREDVPRAEEPKEEAPPFLLAAYLPASASLQALEDYAPSFALLDRVTVITGLCWEEDGSVRILEEGYAALLETLRRLYQGEIYATIYPARSLIREGRAGVSVDTAQKRSLLAENVLALAEEYALDGIDLDWETPADDTEWDLCSETICTLKEALSGQGKGLSVALYPQNSGRLTPAARDALDTLNLMTYDQFDENGFHSTYEMMTDAVRQALSEGYAPAQVLPGIPAYGRPFDGAPSWPLYRDAGLGRGEDVRDGAAYNSVQTVETKTAFARRTAGGVFFYHLLGDLPADDPLSLLHAAEGTA